jgi:hypothetical protein
MGLFGIIRKISLVIFSGYPELVFPMLKNVVVDAKVASGLRLVSVRSRKGIQNQRSPEAVYAVMEIPFHLSIPHERNAV